MIEISTKNSNYIKTIHSIYTTVNIILLKKKFPTVQYFWSLGSFVISPAQVKTFFPFSKNKTFITRSGILPVLIKETEGNKGASWQLHSNKCF